MKPFLFSEQEAKHAYALLSKRQIVAFPTDTVYGLAALAENSPDLYNQLAKIKKRPQNKAFPLMVGNLKQIEKVCDLKNRDYHLIQHFMPGPITFIFSLKAGVFPFLQERSLAVRMAFGREIMESLSQLDYGIWLSSANLSGKKTSLNSDEVLEELGHHIDALVLGESLGKSSSSIFDLRYNEIVQVRKGPIKKEDILKEVLSYEKNSISM